MKTRGTLLAIAMAAAGAFGASAQPLPPMVGPPVYYAPGPLPPAAGPYGGRVVVAPPIVAVAPPYDGGIASYEVVGILRTTGFLPLGAPMRRGRYYVISAIHPNGDDGRVTIDAMTGRFVRFVPADVVASGSYYDDDAYYDDRSPAMSARAPRPPAAVPKMAKANPVEGGAAVTPKPRPQAAPAPVAAQAPAAPARSAPAARPADPPQPRPSFSPQPTQDMPPVQPIE